MKKLAIAVLLSASITVPAFAMEIKDYPRTLEELNYCVEVYFTKGATIPEGCKPLWVRVAEKVTAKK